MKKGFIYIVKKGETLESIADDYGISVYQLRSFHNLWCEDIIDGIGYEIWEGKRLTVEKEKPSDEIIEKRKEIEYQQEKEKKESQKQKEEEAKRSEHEDKFFVVDGAKCLCDKGLTPTLKVTSHSKTIFNNRNNDEKHTATLEDVQFKEGNSCFGSCKVKNNNPCAFVPAGRWKKPYKKLKIMDKEALIEISYLMCSVGGKITIQHHGQSVKMGSNNFQKADAEILKQVLPGLNFEEFQAEYDENQYYL